MICPRCQSPLPQNATSCPRCGLLFYPQQGPGAQQQSDKSNTGWIIAAVLTVLIIGALVAGIIWWSQSKSSSSSGATVTTTTTQTTTSDQATTTSPTVAVTVTTTTTTQAPDWPAGVTATCSSSVAVNPNASCPFAINVANAVTKTLAGGHIAPGNSISVRAYSPARDDFYTMNCTEDVVVLCRGGDNASVYIRI